MEYVGEASERAQKLETYGNPSTTVYRLTEELERMKLKQMVVEFVRSVGDNGTSLKEINEAVALGTPHCVGAMGRKMNMLKDLMLELKSDGLIDITANQIIAGGQNA